VLQLVGVDGSLFTSCEIIYGLYSRSLSSNEVPSSASTTEKNNYCMRLSWHDKYTDIIRQCFQDNNLTDLHYEEAQFLGETRTITSNKSEAHRIVMLLKQSNHLCKGLLEEILDYVKRFSE
jgi:hypothetical protein